MSNATTVDIRGNNQNLKGALGDSEGMVSSFGKKVVAIFAAVAAAVVAKQIFNFGADLVKAAAESEEAEMKLGAVLKATGNAAGYTREQLVQLSNELQNTTKFEAETTQGAMGILASFRNVRGESFIDATKAAQDMATVLGTDLNGAAMQLGKALNDPVAGINALKRSGVTFTESQEEMINALVKSGDVMGAQKIILEELKNEFGGAAEEVGKTFSGRMEQMVNRFGDIKEDLGAIIISLLEPLLPVVDAGMSLLEGMVPIIEAIANGFLMLGEAAFASLAPFFGWIEGDATNALLNLQDVLVNGIQLAFEAMVPAVVATTEAIVQFGAWLFDKLKPVFEWLLDAGIMTFVAMQIAVEEWSTISRVAMLKFSLAVYGAFKDVEHWLTRATPEYLAWFARNWKNIFFDLANYHGTVLQNMGKNLLDFLSATADWLAGKGFNFEFTGLLKGFESTLEKLPEIAERQKSGAEKILQKEVDAEETRLGNKFGERFNEYKNALGSLFSRNQLDKEESKVDMAHNANLKFDPSAFTTKDEKEGKEKKEKKEKEDDGKASFEGLEALHSRIQAAAASAAKEAKEDEREKKKAEEHAAMLKGQQAWIDAADENVIAEGSLENAIVDLDKSINDDFGSMLDDANKAAEIQAETMESSLNQLIEVQKQGVDLLKEIRTSNTQTATSAKTTSEKIETVGALY